MPKKPIPEIPFKKGLRERLSKLDRKIPDYLTRLGETKRLCKEIEDYWEQRGFLVKTYIETFYVGAEMIKHYAIRSTGIPLVAGQKNVITLGG